MVSWALHSTDGFSVGPANNHYHCFRVYIPSTWRFRFVDKWQLYPAHCQVPVVSEHNTALLVAANLFKQLGRTIPTTTASAKLKHLATICQLSMIMSGQLNFPPPLPTSPRVETDPPPRVAIATPSRVAPTSNAIMTPHTICQLPIVHQLLTHHNNLFQILNDDDDDNIDDDTVVASNCSPPSPLPTQYDHPVPTATPTTALRPPTRYLQPF